jgi:copper chaperone CopZ
MKNILLSTLFILLTLNGFSQKTPKIQTVVISTSSQCDDCKERIEEKLNYTKGIKFAELNLETNKVEVKFSTKKITLLEIKNIFAGYRLPMSAPKRTRKTPVAV